MRLMLHTLRKDARRLWPVAAMTWVLLAVLADLDRWRADRMASSLEGWLNLLLPLAWVCLIALVVLEEPLVGDRNFWTTRPHSRGSLLAAKLAFAALAVHLPVLLADAFVLNARGFSPFSFGKQITLLVVVTLPALALATLVRNFAHFVIAVFAVVCVLAVLNGGLQGVTQYAGASVAVRHGLVGLVVAIVGISVIAIQYKWRRAWTARVIAVIGALAAGLLSTLLPVRAEYAYRGRSPMVQVILRDARPDAATIRSVSSNNQRTVLIPIAVQMLSGQDKMHVPMIEVEVIAGDGTTIRSVLPSRSRPFEKIPLLAFPYYTADRPVEWLVLRFSAPAWEQLRGKRVAIRGSAAIALYQLGAAAEIPIQGTGVVPRLGLCTSSVVDDRYFEDIVKVLCESPRVMPAASVVLRHEALGRDWREGLNSSITYSPGPHDTWLSPLQRGQVYFRLTNNVETGPGSQWLVPKEYVPALRVSITPEIATGYALAPFEFKDIDLSAR